MIRVQYTIDDGVLPITVELLEGYPADEPNVIVDSNVHVSYGTYEFTNIFDGQHTLRITDSKSCTYEAPVSSCTNCYPGYTPVGDLCVLYEEESPTYTTPTFSIMAKSPNSSYGSYGALLFDSWNYNGTGTYERLLNSYWRNDWTVNGPLNRTAVWSSVIYDDQDIGFSFCIDIAVEKIYYVGFGCDNYGKVKLNGEYIIEQDVTALTNMIVSNGDSYDGYPDRIPFRYWYIYPLTIPAGRNVIEVFGHNDYSTAAVGIQIYDATPSQLKIATSDADLGDKILFDSIDLVGQDLQYEYSTTNGFHGYSCNEGFALDTCGETVKCIKRDELACGESPFTTTTTTLLPTTTTTSTTNNIDLCLYSNLVFEETLSFTPQSVAFGSHWMGSEIVENADYIFVLMTNSAGGSYEYFSVVRYTKLGGAVTTKVMTTGVIGDNHKLSSGLITSSGSLLVCIEKGTGSVSHNSNIDVFRWTDPSDLDTYTVDTFTAAGAYPTLYEINGGIYLDYRNSIRTRRYHVSTDDGATWGAANIWASFTALSWWPYTIRVINGGQPDSIYNIFGPRCVYNADAFNFITVSLTDFVSTEDLAGTSFGSVVSESEILASKDFGATPPSSTVYRQSYFMKIGDYLYGINNIGTYSGLSTSYTSYQIFRININDKSNQTSGLISLSERFIGTWVNWCGKLAVKRFVSPSFEYYTVNDDFSGLELVYTETPDSGYFSVHQATSATTELIADYNPGTNSIRVWRFSYPESIVPALPPTTSTTTSTTITPVTTTSTTTLFPPSTTTTTTMSLTLLSGVISVWELNETSGTTAFDAHGSNDGANNSAVVNQSGILGTSYYLNSAYIGIPNTDGVFNLGGNFTVSMWVKIAYPSIASRALLALGTSLTTKWQYMLYATGAETDDTLSFYVRTASGASSAMYSASNGSIFDSNWIHVVGTYDSSLSTERIKLYLNGSEEAVADGYAEDIVGIDEELAIGKWGSGTTPLVASTYVDQTAIWGRTLSDTEVAQLYNSGNGLAYINW